MLSKVKRMKYSASFKLQVVKFASDNSNNSAASRKFGIDEKLVRDWRRKIDNIKSLPKTKCADRGRKKCGISNALDGTEDDLVWEEEEDSSQVEEEPDCDVYDDRITPEQWQELFGESDDEEEFHGFWRKTNKQTAPLGATKYEKRNDQCFVVLKLALELSKYRYRGYLFVFKIYCSNFILEFQIFCLFYLTDEN